jgi:CDGSH-type Zn-finger protein
MRQDGGTGEVTPTTNTLRMVEDGPLYLRGDLEVLDQEGEVLHRDTRLALCRCGASSSKPFCDGQHTETGFTDPGVLVEVKVQQGTTKDGKLRITPLPDGPVLVAGPFEIVEPGGKALAEGGRAALCRCGAAASKPFCDGSHSRIEFKA